MKFRGPNAHPNRRQKALRLSHYFDTASAST